MVFKVIIFGGRNFKDYQFLESKCDVYLKEIKEVIEIVSGKQCSEDREGNKWGADYLGELYAAKRGYPVTPFPANWGKYGKAAGIYRNIEMGNYGDAGIGFWDGRSRGTKNMIEVLRGQNKPLRIVYF